jgi:hypothetical protein
LWDDWRDRLDYTYLPPAAAPWVAQIGTYEERWELAQRGDLGEETFGTLLEVHDHRIHDILAVNRYLPRTFLDQIAIAGLANNEYINGHQNAPIESKRALPSKHVTGRSLELLLDEVHATDSERNAVWRTSAAEAGRPLGEIWDAIRTDLKSI